MICGSAEDHSGKEWGGNLVKSRCNFILPVCTPWSAAESALCCPLCMLVSRVLWSSLEKHRSLSNSANSTDLGEA